MKKSLLKQLFATILVVCLTFGLVACGNSAATGPTNVAQPAPAESTPATGLDETPADDPMKLPPEDTPAEFAPELETEPEHTAGELMMYCIYPNGYDCDIYSVNPETGEYERVLRFDGAFPAGGTRSADVIGIYANYLPRLGFNDDLTLMAVTRWDEHDRTEHAGWLDENSNFCDVQVLVFGEPDDFAGTVAYEALGFTPDGLFVYREKKNPDRVYYVDSHNPAERFEGDPIMTQFFRGMVDLNMVYAEYAISDWVDDDKFIATTNDEHHVAQSYGPSTASYPAILSASDPGYIETFLPKSERVNYGGVISPDGTEIAFMSRQNGTVMLFIVPRDGSSSPRKVIEFENFYLEPLTWR